MTTFEETLRNIVRDELDRVIANLPEMIVEQISKQPPKPTGNPNDMLRKQEVLDLTGLSNSTLYREMDKGRFPASIPIGTRGVGWLRGEVESWRESRRANQ